jgi:hypothetical protein
MANQVRKLSSLEEEMLKLTETMSERESEILFENLKRKIFKGGAVSSNPENEKKVILRYLQAT